MGLTRNYQYIDQYLNELLDDIYPAPPDEGHTELTGQIINKWVAKLTSCNSVLDVGCGEAFAQPMFENLRIEYTGVCLGEDYINAKLQGRNVFRQDFTFLEFPDNSFDLVFARHSLEHSPMAILTLMEWWRIAKQWLCLVLPAPKYWLWGGRNHYGMVSATQARFLLDRAGWKPIWEDMKDEREFRWTCEKVERVNKYKDEREEYEREE